MIAKEFLRIELDNLKESLEEALRFDYGPSGSQQFFEECFSRFGMLEKRWSGLKPDAHDDLTRFASALRDLGILVHSIERANETEVSWPFVSAIKEFAEAFLKEDLPGSKGAPLILACATGGVDNYWVHPEDFSQNEGIISPIHMIEFPRTLKHYVLLHPIFAHEIGHAAWKTPKYEEMIPPTVTNVLAATPLASDREIAGWLEAAFGSKMIRALRDEMRESWPEEVFSDLFGIYTFGPAYAWAFKSLVFGMDPSGWNPTRHHPPPYVRAFALKVAWSHLKWNDPTRYSRKSNAAAQTFAKGPFADMKFPSAARSLVKKVQITQILALLDTLAANSPGLACPSISPPLFELLVRKVKNWVPPCGSGVFTAAKGPDLRAIDFRSILIAGWFSWTNHALKSKEVTEAKRFKVINKLCEAGIAHQIGIRHFVDAGGPTK